MIGLVLIAAGFLLDPDRSSQAYLWAYLFVLSLPLGALSLRLIGDLTGGRWTESVRPLADSMTATLPFLALLSFPVLGVRAVGYFVLWILLTLARGSRSGPALMAHLFVTSLASVQFILALDHGMESTIFGLLWMSIQAMAALSFMVLRGARSYDLGGLLLVTVMLTGYLGFSQLVIAWAGNLPGEAAYYSGRVWGAWGPLAAFLFLFALYVPFVCLIWGQFKKHPRRLATVAALTLLGSALMHLWLVLPAFPGRLPGWSDLLEGAGLFWLWLTLFRWRFHERL